MSSLIVFNNILRVQNPVFWMPYIVLANLIVFAFTLQTNNVVHIALKSFFNLQFFKQSIRNNTNSVVDLGRVLIVNTFVVLGLTVYYFLGDILSRIYSLDKAFVFFTILILIILWYWLNIAVRKIIAKVSSIDVIEKEMELYNQFFFQSLGVLLLPGLVGLYYFPIDFLGFNFRFLAEVYVQLIIVLTFVNKLFQSIFQSFEIKISWFYIFLYLCTLEILPLCIGYQLLLG